MSRVPKKKSCTSKMNVGVKVKKAAVVGEEDMKITITLVGFILANFRASEEFSHGKSLIVVADVDDG